MNIDFRYLLCSKDLWIYGVLDRIEINLTDKMLPPGPSYDHTCEQLRGTNSQRTTVLKPWTKQEQIFIQESESPFNPLIPFQSASRDEELQSQILKAFSKGGVVTNS